MQFIKHFILNILILLYRIPLGKWIGKQKRKNAILVMRTDLIGDCIIWLDSAKEYKKQFPDAHIVLLYNKAWKDLALQMPYFDECIPFDGKRFMKSIRYYFVLLKQINAYHYQKVFNTMYARNFFIQDWIVRNVSADEKTGFGGNYTNTNNTLAKLTSNFTKYNAKLYNIANKWYDKLIVAEQGTKMELLRNAEFIQGCLNPAFKADLPVFPFEIKADSNMLSEKYVVFALGASTPRKAWNIEKFAAVAQKISQRYSIVCCGTQNERILYWQMKQLLAPNTNIINLCGKTTLTELFGVIKYARFVVTNDTGTSHIAVATQTPSVVILGGGHFGQFHPYPTDIIQEVHTHTHPPDYLPMVVCKPMECYHCGWICKYPLQNGKWKCIADINTDDVMEKVDILLNRLNNEN
ncbi:MAG: glycosyltransferase family 9 protein [Bacteroidales bacterium]|nr:glycosyltransferase family 9 protein [Bacteroidales bacterium]